MRVFVTGATGFIGSALSLRLRREGHEVVAWVRDLDRARAILGAEVELHAMDSDGLPRVLGRCDAVVNLAGAPVAKRWTAATRTAIRDSRVNLTERLVHAMRACPRPPSVLVSTSAVGWYGDGSDRVLTEDTELASGFLAEVCRDWEAAALEAEELDTRVAIARIGLVLGAEGGARAVMEPAFRRGLGAVLGGGDQYVPWIHLDDVVQMYVTALTDDAWRGAFNATAPHPVTNRAFTEALAHSLGAKARLRVPKALLSLAFGPAARIMLASQRVVPQRALDLGYTFCFPALGPALRDLADTSSVRFGPPTALPKHDYVTQRRPAYLLEQTVEIDAPIEDVFPFFSQAENLGALTPPMLAFDIATASPIDMKVGREIKYRIRVGPVPMRWLTVIEGWEPTAGFSDAQHRGPYRCWFHEHRFEARGARTLMKDRVWYAPPLGLVGRLANRLFIQGMLERIFAFRRRAIAHRFGLAERLEAANEAPRTGTRRATG